MHTILHILTDWEIRLKALGNTGEACSMGYRMMSWTIVCASNEQGTLLSHLIRIPHMCTEHCMHHAIMTVASRYPAYRHLQ